MGTEAATQAGHTLAHPDAAQNPASEAAALDAVTIVVVTYNSAHCVPGMALNFVALPHVIVVDNASEDGTLAAVARHMPQAQCIALPRNQGFGAANNAALAQVQTPFALLVNPDCAMAPADVAALVTSAQQWPNAAIVAPQLIGRGGDLQINYGWARRAWKAEGPPATGAVCVGNACGAVMLLRLDAMPNRRWFDERFFLYYEDEDLCLRLLQAGQPVVIEPAVQVAHANRGSVRGPRPWRVEYGRGFHHARSKVLFTAKHEGESAARKHRRRALWGAFAMLGARVFAPSPRHICRVAGRIAGLWNAPTRY